jgi:hypothetical protein
MANALEALWTAFSGFAPRLLGAGLVFVFTLSRRGAARPPGIVPLLG